MSRDSRSALFVGGTVNTEYSSNAYTKEVFWDFTISIPTLNGVQLPKIKGVVVTAPGVGGRRDYKVDDRWAKFLYEHGLAYIGPSKSDLPASYFVDALDSFAGDDLGGTTYGELLYAPLLPFGESNGGSVAYHFAVDYPERTIAYVAEHTRLFDDAFSDLADPTPTKNVPGYYRWGEWDHVRFNDGYYKLSKSMVKDKFPIESQVMGLIESRQEHATTRYALEEAMGYFGLMLPLRYDYQEGVIGKDPSLGPVDLIHIPFTNGYLGEHIIGGIQTEGDDDSSTLDDNYANLMKDWESADPYVAPYSSFERSDLKNHSWMPNETIAAFWASKFAYGRLDLKVDYLDLINDDFGLDTVVSRNSVFPNYFLTGQDIRVEVSAWDFADLDRIEFYANEQKIGSVTQAPYNFTYNFAPGQEGMYALYPVAIASNGSRSVGPRRMVQVYANTRGANTAPTISNIGVVSGLPGETISVPFAIGDAETSADALTVNWQYINRTESIVEDSYYITTTGTAAERDLEITLPDQAGIIWGIVQVSDGDMSANAYVQINVTGDGSETPFFVDKEALLTIGPINTSGAWSRRMSVHVYDFDTDAADLTLTASSSNLTNIPQENIILGGAGRFRYLQVKPLGGGSVTLSLSDGNSTATHTIYVSMVSQTNRVPRISDIPDQTASYGNEIDPIEVRVYDLHTSSEELFPSDTPLTLSVTSDNQALIADAGIAVSAVGPRRYITFTPINGQTGSATLTATVTDEGGLTAMDTFVVTVGAPDVLSASAASLEPATATQSYLAQLDATGGIEPYSFTLTSGSLPSGLSLNADGSISGTPTETGSFTFTAQVEDSESTTDSENVTLQVYAYVVPPSDLTATSESNTTITLDWSDSGVGESGYEIQRRVAGDYIWSTITTTAADTVQYNDATSLNFGERYEYRLRALGAVNGAYSSVATADAVAEPVIATQPESVGVLPNHNVTLSVSADGGNLSYQWYEGTSGDTSSPVSGANSTSVSVENVVGERNFWVEVSNAAGQVNSQAATVSVNMAAPSLKINLGSDAGSGWNSYPNFGMFEGGTDYTDSNLVYTTGSDTQGVSLTMTRSSTNEPFCDYFSSYPLPGYTGDWLNDAAATSAWGIGLDNNSIRYEITGLPAGSYSIEAYSYASSSTGSDNDGSTYPAYKLDASRMVAGISGASATTTSDFSSALYDAEDHATELLRWTNVTIEEGEALELTASSTNNLVINAFIIKGVQLANPEIGIQPASESINNGDSTTLSVTAFGNGTLQYQWYQGALGDTSNPVGTDSASFTTPAITVDTDYWVRVSDDNGLIDSSLVTIEVPDITAPAAIADLAAEVGNSEITLTWTAPGDDGNLRTASSYDVRYSTSPISNVTDFENAFQVAAPLPASPGTQQSLVISELDVDTTYYVAIRTRDEIPNVSALSNVASQTTSVFPAYWEAWHNTQIEVVNPNDAVVSKGDTHTVPIALVNSKDGSEIGATVTYTFGSNDPYWHGSGVEELQVVEPIENTDYQAVFGGKLLIDTFLTRYSPSFGNDDKPVEMKFSNLPSGTYEIILSCNRGKDAADTGIWIEDASGYTNVSSAGALIDNDYSLIPALNTYTGYVASWVNITPTAEGGTSFTIKTKSPGGGEHPLPQVVILKRTAPTPAPLILQQPKGGTFYIGEEAVLTVAAESRSANAGTLAFQWYEGVTGDVSSPISGATSASYTTPEIISTDERHYWVTVTDDNGIIASDTATVAGKIVNWTAYHNTISEDVPIYEGSLSQGDSDGVAFTLRDYATAEPLAASLRFDMTGSFVSQERIYDFNDAAIGTDVDLEFSPVLAFTQKHTYSQSATKSVEVVFDDLPDTGSYDVSLSLSSPNYWRASTGDLYFGESVQTFTIENASGYSNSSSAPAIIDADSTAFVSDNQSNGYVAKWTNITPTANGGRSFSIRVTTTDPYLFVPTLIKIESHLSGPRITAHPESISIALNENFSMSVDAIASTVGSVSYQWYQGLSGDTSTLIAGATASTYTTPALGVEGEHPYWVAVTDANGTTASLTAVVTVDDSAPAAVSDLSAAVTHVDGFTLGWTAPGDDGELGTATSYDIRYSRSPIHTDTDFENATQIPLEPAPALAGSAERLEIRGLLENETYYFALKTQDEVGNISARSTTLMATTRIVPTSWEAWHNSIIGVVDPNDAVTSEGIAIGGTYTYWDNGQYENSPTGEGSISLRDSSDGSYIGATLSFEYDRTNIAVYDSDPLPAGTDHDTFFSGKLNSAQAARMDLDDSPLRMTVGNLRPGTYELILGQSGQPQAQEHRKAYYTITDASGYTNESSPAIIEDNDTSLMTADNTTTGHVARWTGIVPTGQGGTSFSIDISEFSTSLFGYVPSVAILKYTGPSGGVPVIGTQPVGSSVDAGNTVTLQVAGAASAGQLTFQWYEGTAGDTSSPISGATLATYTTPEFVAEGSYTYWVAVSDDNATVHSDTATVNVTEPDLTAPGAVTDLSISGVTPTGLTLSWTAPGDDGASGTATSYDLRYSSSAILSDADFDTASSLSGEPSPSVGGSSETMTLSGLSPETEYYFALKTQDEQANVSALSNVANATTDALDLTAPAAINDLGALAASSGSITLTWTATGDDALIGTATAYDVRYSSTAITNDTDFNNATQVNGAPTPSLSGSSESFSVSGLAEDSSYYFAIKVSDEAGNTSTFSNVLSASTTAPLPPEQSLLFNFGSTVTGNWNNFPDNSMLSAGTLKTGLNGFIYDDGSEATDVTLDVEYSAGKGNVVAINPMTDTHSEDWLTAEASQSAWYMQVAAGGIFKFRLNDLPPGNYEVEAYIYQDQEADYRFNGLNALAGVLGATQTTESAYSTASFDAASAGDSRDQIAKWTGIVLAEGQILEIEINGGSVKRPIINAIRISKMQEAAPETSFASWASEQGISNDASVDTDQDGINNFLEYALDLDPHAASAGMPTGTVEHDSGTDYLTLTYRKNLDAPGLVYTVEVSEDLISWVPVSALAHTEEHSDIDGDGSAARMKVRVAINALEKRKFVRLNVSISD